MRLTKLGMLSMLPVLTYAQETASQSSAKQFRDWSLKCDRFEGDREGSCYMSQRILLRGSSKTLVDVAVGYFFSAEDPAAIFTLPLGIYLPTGTTVKVDDTDAIHLTIERCDGGGCQAGLVLNKALRDRFKKGKMARIMFQDARGKNVSVPISLLGFTAAMDEITGGK